MHFSALTHFVTRVHMLGPNSALICAAALTASLASANKPKTVAPLPLIIAPAAPFARSAPFSKSKTGNFPTDGASNELNNAAATPAKSSFANARISKVTGGGVAVNPDVGVGVNPAAAFAQLS